MQAPLIYVALAAAAVIGIGVMLGQQSATSESVPVAEGQAEAANAGNGAASRDTAAPAVVLARGPLGIRMDSLSVAT